MTTKQPIHVRLPQRAEAVEGREGSTGQPPEFPSVKDPRTVTQDPTLKPNVMTP